MDLYCKYCADKAVHKQLYTGEYFCKECYLIAIEEKVYKEKDFKKLRSNARV